MKENPVAVKGVIPISASRWLLLWWTFVLFSVLLAVTISDLAVWVKAAFYLAIIVYAGMRWKNVFYGPVRTLSIQRDTKWHVMLADGSETAAELMHCTLWYFLIILHFSLDNGKQCVVLLTQDNIDKNSHRRLRVNLKSFSV